MSFDKETRRVVHHWWVCLLGVILGLAGCSVTGESTNQGGGAQHSVTLNWEASTSAVVGYYAYRGTTSGGPYSKLNPNSIDPNTSYVDTTVTNGQTYYYVVTSVDSSGLESTYSTQVTATVP